ncbi:MULTISPECIES: thioredoxin family protein [unclassified Sphingobacterium]|uniref:thioredoxin family protein n=1 Tax=unclassified Sphingobacterium TaxID=2609468 RepID=UPI00104BF7FE|nr:MULTISPECIES: thioredoxin family protein [unclassified Sphingobacterium]MCS3556148.1 thioredoxin-related protein [Sphingobacterium sp. JUb21]TCR08524.1 thioredoxin-related protein [Sphingobacterium sp. JUb20]
MKYLIFLVMLFPLMVGAQEQGTRFEHGLSWEEVKNKAKKENKYLFVDCFTTWCGPCKYMARDVFPQEKVGNFFNKHFVNVKVQFDKKKDDSEEVKQWYADAEKIAKEFNVKAYPTFLIIAPDGQLVHRIVGGINADAFIPMVEKALNPETQYYKLLKKYEAGTASPEMLRELIPMSVQAYESDKTEKMVSAYLDKIENPYTKETLDLIAEYSGNVKSRGFQLILANQSKTDAVWGEGKSEIFLRNAILRDELTPLVASGSKNPDSLIAVVTTRYPTINLKKTTDFWAVQFYQKNRIWDKFKPAVLSYMKENGSELELDIINGFAASMCECSDNPTELASALAWSKRCVVEGPEEKIIYRMIYPRLLYKVGNKEEAIAAQQKLIEIDSGEKSKAFHLAVLEQMKKGEKNLK